MADLRRFKAWILTQSDIRSTVTAEEYPRRLRNQVAKEIEPLTLDALTEEDAILYLAEGRSEHEWTFSQYNNRAKALNAWFRFRDGRKDNPLRLLPEEFEEYRALDAAQVERIKAVLPHLPAEEAGPVAWLLGTGLRPGESVKVEDGEVDLDARTSDGRVVGTVLVRKPGKRGKRRRVMIAEWALPHLRRYREARPRPLPTQEDRGAFWLASHNGKVARMQPGSLTRILRRVGASVGVEVNAQIARHTWATLAAQEGASVLFIQRQLGHTTPKHTARYAEVRDQDIIDGLSRLRAFKSHEPQEEIL
ncbi:MAG TPA: site-specific integrase [Candidatus Thermoplasmatota archaeon]|nr:site-specific integrase [Candidatus Thermoplasmatota archaeon]